MNRIFTLITFIAFFFTPFLVFGDENKKDDFDSLYVHIATVISLQNMDSAIILADSLLESVQEDPMRKMRSYMLLASLKDHEGEVLSSLVYASKADKIATEIKNIEWQMRIAGFLYTTYNGVGLPEQGKQYLKKVERLNETEKIPLIQLYVHQAKAKLYLEDSLAQEALNELIQTENLIENLLSQKVGPIIIATTYQLKGLSYFQLNEIEKAKENFYRAKELIPDNYSVLLGYIYIGLANIYLKENDLEQAFYYLEKIEPILEGSKDFSLKIMYNSSWKSYYLQSDNPVMADKYDKNLLVLKSEKTTYLAKISNQLIQELKEDSNKKTKSSLMLISLISSLVILIAMIVIYNIDKRKQQQKKYETIVTEVKDWFDDK